MRIRRFIAEARRICTGAPVRAARGGSGASGPEHCGSRSSCRRTRRTGRRSRSPCSGREVCGLGCPPIGGHVARCAPTHASRARGSFGRVSTSLTRCDACARDTETTDDWRCHYCGRRKADIAEPAATTPHAPPTVWEDMRPQLAAAALALLIAVIGLLVGSALLLVVAAAVLVAAAVSKIVADGW